jgi:hypothetical protein
MSTDSSVNFVLAVDGPAEAIRWEMGEKGFYVTRDRSRTAAVYESATTRSTDFRGRSFTGFIRSGTDPTSKLLQPDFLGVGRGIYRQ